MTEAEPHACSPKPRSLLPGGHVTPSVSEKLAEPTSCHQPISFHVLLESNPHPGGEVRGRRKAALLQESRKQGPVQEGRCSHKGWLGDGSVQLSPLSLRTPGAAEAGTGLEAARSEHKAPSLVLGFRSRFGVQR